MTLLDASVVRHDNVRDHNPTRVVDLLGLGRVIGPKIFFPQVFLVTKYSEALHAERESSVCIGSVKISQTTLEFFLPLLSPNRCRI